MNIYEVTDPAIDTFIIKQEEVNNWLRQMQKYGYHQTGGTHLIGDKAYAVIIRVLPAEELVREEPLAIYPLKAEQIAVADAARLSNHKGKLND